MAYLHDADCHALIGIIILRRMGSV